MYDIKLYQAYSLVAAKTLYNRTTDPICSGYFITSVQTATEKNHCNSRQGADTTKKLALFGVGPEDILQLNDKGNCGESTKHLAGVPWCVSSLRLGQHGLLVTFAQHIKTHNLPAVWSRVLCRPLSPQSFLLLSDGVIHGVHCRHVRIHQQASQNWDCG